MRDGAPRDASDAEAGGLRLRAHPVQHRRVRRHEDAEHARGDARRRAPARPRSLREGLSILLRVLYPVVPHTTWVLWHDLGFADALGDLLDAPWPAGRRRRRSRRTRSSSCCRSTASCAASSSCRRRPTGARSRPRRARAPEVAQHGSGAPVKKVDRRARDGSSMSSSESAGRRSPSGRSCCAPASRVCAIALAAAASTCAATRPTRSRRSSSTRPARRRSPSSCGARSTATGSAKVVDDAEERAGHPRHSGRRRRQGSAVAVRRAAACANTC